MGVEGVASDTVGIRPTRHRAGAARFRSVSGNIYEWAQRLMRRDAPSSAANPEINWRLTSLGWRAVDGRSIPCDIRPNPASLIDGHQLGGGVYAMVNTI